MKKIIFSLLGLTALVMLVAPLFQSEQPYSTCISRDNKGNCTAWMDVPN